MKILLVGNGKMAKAVSEQCSKEKINCTQFCSRSVPDMKLDPKEYIIIHFGSGELLRDTIELSKKNGVPIIQGSTNEKSLEEMNNSVDTRIVYAPNLSIPIVKLVGNIKSLFSELLKFMDLSVTESHQAGKVDISGTARFILNNFDVSEERISKIRNPIIQRNVLGVPKRFLSGHAYHTFFFEGMGASIKIETKIHGRETYAEGALILARGLNRLAQKDELKLISNSVVNFTNLPDWVYLPEK